MMVTRTKNQESYMQRAIELAERGRGLTTPNPLTGCVVVKDGRVLGEGYHKGYRKQHAEVAALQSCTESPRGAQLFCNLEPCSQSYTGKSTPPCVPEIIRAGISVVTISTLDPNPFVNGQGVDRLRAVGIKVEIGDNAEAALKLNLPFFTGIHYHRPFVHIKIAQSLDGRIATRNGDSQWITDQTARRLAHEIRSKNDAILIGCNTAIQDDPKLTVRYGRTQQSSPKIPWRIVLDTKLRLSTSAKLVTDQYVDQTIVLTSDLADKERQKQLVDTGIRVIQVPVEPSGWLDLKHILKTLYTLGIRSILVEGGNKIFTSFLKSNNFDQITAFVSPIIIGTGIPTTGDLGNERINEVERLQDVTTKIINDQVMISGFRNLDALRNLVLPDHEHLYSEGD